MTELLELAERIVDRAGSDEDVEAFVTHEREFEVKAYDGAVETSSAAEPRGAGIRVVTDHRVGFAFTTDLSESGLDEVLSDARENARHTTPDEAVGLPEAQPEPDEVAGMYEASFEDADAETKAAFAIELEQVTRNADPRIRTVEEAGYSDSVTEVAIASTKGVRAAYRRSDAWCYSIAIAGSDADTEVGFEFDLARSLQGLDAADVGRRAADRALRVLGASKIPSARMPVVFDPYTSAQFLGVLARVLTGEAVQKGRSLFAGRLDDKVAAGGMNLVDDGRFSGAPGAAPWDGEGVPTRRTEVISDGILTSFLYDTVSARREGRATTANAARSGFKTPPGPSPSNMAFDPTGESRDEVLKSAGRALLVQDFHGVHSGANPISGDFSVGVTGALLENGAIGKPVKEVTIAAPMLDILANITAVADDRRWLPFGGSFGGATTLIAEMTVAGS